MHSSRMRTRRPYAGVCFPGGGCLVRGGCLPGPGEVYSWGVSAPLGGGGVCSWGEGCLPDLGGGVCLVQGVCSGWGCLLPGGGRSVWSGGGVSQNALRQTPSLQWLSRVEGGVCPRGICLGGCLPGGCLPGGCLPRRVSTGGCLHRGCTTFPLHL